jgi:hypothetical protein
MYILDEPSIGLHKRDNAWLAEQKANAYRSAYEEMRAKYTIILPTAPDSADEGQGEETAQ